MAACRSVSPMRSTAAISIRRFLTGLFVGALLWGGFGTPLSAHPHSWIDIKVSVLFDGDGRVAALKEIWLFDEVYTAFILEGVKRPTDEILKKIADRIMVNLTPYSYFTHPADGKNNAIKPGGVEDVGAILHDKKRFELDFTVRLAEPAAADGFSYSIYDPTYYIEMLHAEGGGAVRLEQAPPSCAYRLIKPNPSMEAVLRASSLDSAASAPAMDGADGLGALFAERIVLKCP